MSSVAILVSTYNGEKYLREQLDSILAQSGVTVEVFVRDDGSSDNTKDILTEYEKSLKNFHVAFCENVGVGNSFMNLLYSVPDTFDYYAFADQDDIWEENKIAEAIRILEESGKMLYASNQECVDKDGVSLGLRYEKNCKIHHTPLSILSKNMLAGCTMVFSNRFYKILSDTTHHPSADLLHNRIHDVWLAMIASLYDGIIYDERSFIQYRQHENNVVGAKSSFRKRLKEKYRKVFHREYRNGRSLLAREVCEKFPEEAQKYPLLELCANSKSCKGKRRILKHQKELRSYTGEKFFGFYMKVTFGLF